MTGFGQPSRRWKNESSRLSFKGQVVEEHRGIPAEATRQYARSCSSTIRSGRDLFFGEITESGLDTV